MEKDAIIKNTPRDVFLHLLNIFTFYAGVISFITLFIQYIETLFPDPLNFYYTGMADAIRRSTSILVIAIPVFLFTSWLLSKVMGSIQEKRDFKLRKWLIYFTLFISAITIIVDLITFVNNFLGGELTIRFFLKVLVVLFVASAVFGYYIWELGRKNMASKTPKILAFIVSFVVFISIVAGFFIIGTPGEQRQRRFDEQRVGDLQMLQGQIINHWVQKEALPLKLSDLEDSISGFKVPADPETKLSYEYKTTGSLSFELCAIFKTSNQDIRSFNNFQGFQQNWEHKAERTCFTRTIDPELYKFQSSNPPIKTIVPARQLD
jgi:hypothetical protein